LEAFQILKVIAEVVRGLLASSALLINLLPDAIYPGDLISEKVFVSKLHHDIANLTITISYESVSSILDIISPFSEVIVKLINELGAFFECEDVSLTATVSLLLNHGLSS
jgi:hypothetical protein